MVVVLALSNLAGLFQMAILGYTMHGLLTKPDWAYSEQPLGQFNAWIESGNSGARISAATDYTRSFVYCGNASYRILFSRFAWLRITLTAETPGSTNQIAKFKHESSYISKTHHTSHLAQTRGL